MSNFRAEAQRSGNAAGLLAGKAVGAGLTAGVGVGLAGLTAVVGTAAASAGYALNKGFQRLKTIDTAEFQLKALGYSIEEVGRISKDVTDVVTGTPIALEEAFGSAVMFLGAGVEQGDELNRILTAIADAAGFSGSSFQDLAIIFSQVMNMGKLQAGDLLQLHQRNIPVQKWIQKELRITAEEYEKMSRDGQISMEHLLAAVENNLGGMAKRMGDTLEGSLSNLRTAAARVGATFITAASGGDTENITDGVSSITEAIDGLNDVIKSHQPEIIGFFTTVGTQIISFGRTGLEVLWNFTAGIADWIGVLNHGWANVLDLQASIAEISPWGDKEQAKRTREEANRIRDIDDSWQAAANSMRDGIDKLDELQASLQGAGDRANDAAKFTRDLGDAIKKAQVGPDGAVILKAPTAEELNKIDEARYRIEQIPDTVDFKIVPHDEEATRATEAWREKEAKKAAEVPVDADAKPAEESVGAWRTNEEGVPVRVLVDPQLEHASAKMSAFVEQWSNAIIRPQVAPGSHAPGSDPLSAMTGSAGVATSGVGYPAMTAPGTGSPSISEVDAIAKQFGLTKTSGHRPGDSGYHGQGLAGDYAGSVENMQKFAAYMAKNYGGHLNELIFDAPGWGANVKDGKITGPFGNVYTLQQAGRHDDHVHIAVRGRASGGAVFGPGTGTSDSIPAWLSNGEHVIPADEVKKAGGQQAIYGLRSMLRRGILPGFADGGAVSDEKWIREQAAKIGVSVEEFTEMLAEGMGAPAGQHQGHGKPPGPKGAPHQGHGRPPGPTATGRTEGYIPAAAGSTAVAGESALSGFLNMGAEVINGLIDQAASAASTAAAAGIAGGTMGVGAAGGSQAGAAAADFAIGLGANAAKRGVSYGFQMGGILADSILEQLTPFGAPRLLTADYTGFVPNLDIMPALTTSLEEQEKSAQEAMNTVDNTTIHGQAQGASPGPNELDEALDFISRATTPPAEPVAPPDPVMVQIDTINATDADDVGRQIAKRQKLAALQHQGRP